MADKATIPIQAGDHVKNTLSHLCGFVQKRGSVGKGKGEVKGFMVWIGKEEEFWPEEFTKLLWTKEEMESESPPIRWNPHWLSEAATSVCLRLGWKCGSILYHSELSLTIMTPKGGPYVIELIQEGEEAIKTRLVGIDAHGTAVDERAALRTVFDFVMWAEISAITGE